MPLRWRLAGLCVVLVVGSVSFAQRSAKAAAPVKAAATSVGLAIPDTTSAINSSTPMSQRVVHYEIDARYDAAKHTVDATEVLTYHNLTGQSLDTFPFHLYLNAFQPKATWVREAKRSGTRDDVFEKWESKFNGAAEIKRFEVEGMGDLTSQLEFIQPDDGNKDDKTVVQVRLPKAIAPNGYVQFKIAFHDQFPETLARTGWKRDFVLGAQWFPKVGVWWHGAWNCHQFHAFTEFFADFGVYDVKLTLPQYEIVGASGLEVSNVNNADGTKTVTYHGDDVHDFAWTASPRYRVKDAEFPGQMGPVKLRILMQPAHWTQVERHERILKQTMRQFEHWYGPYPYKTLTLVDPEPDSAAGGMEYPTFITGGTTWWALEGTPIGPEEVVEHEYGHQYWYGMVATNEFEDAWMDEGINQYTQVKVLDAIFGRDTSLQNRWGITEGEAEAQQGFYAGVADMDPIAQNGYDYYGFGSYGGITYAKTASVLLTLEGIIGEDTMRQAMHTYFMRYRFTHPTKEDFLKTIEEVSGKNLRWYFDPAFYGSPVMDYEVLSLKSTPVDWYVEKKTNAGKEDDKNTVYESWVALHRKGDFVFPVEVEIKFSNGDKVREHWDGKARWVRFGYQKKATVVSAEIDPDHKVYLDRNRFNDSRTAEADPKPARKLGNYWCFVDEWLGQFLAWWGI